jgi:hypothetical protein
MDYGYGVSPLSFSEEYALISDPLMGSLLFGTLLLPPDTMGQSLSRPTYVLTLLLSTSASPSTLDQPLMDRSPSRSRLVLPIPSS